jgi:hypothetical protein
MSIWKGLALAALLWAGLASFLFGVAHLFGLIGWSVMLIYALTSGRAFATSRAQNARGYWAATALIAGLLAVSIVQTARWYGEEMPVAIGEGA